MWCQYITVRCRAEQHFWQLMNPESVKSTTHDLKKGTM